MRARFLAAFVLLSTPAPALAAGELDPSHLPADVRWLIHLDVQGALASELVSGLAQLKGPHVNLDPDWIELREELGLDPEKDLHSVALFSAMDDPEEAVILIEASSAIEQALEALRARVPSRLVEVDGLPLRRWEDEDDPDEPLFTYLARRKDAEERVLVVSPLALAVAQAAHVLRGEARSLADGSDVGLQVVPRPGAFLFVSASEELGQVIEREADSSVARYVQSALLHAGEDAGTTFVEITLHTDSEEQALRLAQVLQGGLALAMLLGQSEPELRDVQRLLSGAVFLARDASVTLDYRQPSATLLDLARRVSQGDALQAVAPGPEAEPEPEPDAPQSPGEWR